MIDYHHTSTNSPTISQPFIPTIPAIHPPFPTWTVDHVSFTVLRPGRSAQKIAKAFLQREARGGLPARFSRGLWGTSEGMGGWMGGWWVDGWMMGGWMVMVWMVFYMDKLIVCLKDSLELDVLLLMDIVMLRICSKWWNIMNKEDGYTN